MKIEKELKEFYKSEISNVDVPSCPFSPETTSPGKRDSGNMTMFRIAFAALIALAFIPLYQGTTRPSALAVRAATVCKTYELETRIPEGLLNLNKITSKSFSTGGKK